MQWFNISHATPKDYCQCIGGPLDGEHLIVPVDENWTRSLCISGVWAVYKRDGDFRLVFQYYERGESDADSA